MKKDICVIGMGRFGNSVVNQLIEMRKSVLAIDKEEINLIKASRITDTAIADGSDLESLKALGIDKFDTVIVAAAENIEIVASLSELGVNHIIAKAKSIAHERVLKQIGVDFIVKPEVEAGIRTALIATNSNFIKYSESLQEVGDGYVIGSTIISDKKYIDKKISELGLKQMGVSIVSLKRDTQVFLPIGSLIIKDGDIVTLIGKIQNITKTFIELNDETSTRMINIPTGLRKNKKEAEKKK